jgi:hypothetical protein
MGLHFLAPPLAILVWLLILTTLISMGQRLMLTFSTARVQSTS